MTGGQGGTRRGQVQGLFIQADGQEKAGGCVCLLPLWSRQPAPPGEGADPSPGAPQGLGPTVASLKPWSPVPLAVWHWSTDIMQFR